ncbi:Hypothetical_protein [Hexamita inflata]|uniref:Hypothetical_protein n=1 Tax=Hexamita inflata TaxID=28002 RepID=A0AA86U0K9_9EUKA|nr:Hypothetical protein HINF_LOCUS23251 [Hexamita inflata]
MKNISLLLQVVTVRTSSDTSSFTDKQSCYIKCSSQLNSTYVQNSSRIWNSVILISFGDSDFNLLLLRYSIKTHTLMTRVCTTTPSSKSWRINNGSIASEVQNNVMQIDSKQIASQCQQHRTVFHLYDH